MALQPLELKDIDKHAENIYEAIVVLSKRARQINEEMKIRLNQELEMFATRVDSEEEIETNPEQMRISIEFEKLSKPTQQAIGDLLDDKLSYHYKDE
ncbi:MAG: DNA-directed RNA polymerase subunit omega [Ignavibacteria bacterium]|jgi:DNA-directed RNA polymerase subunit K/omega|nr:DNA-directed RNA polymerase subunit omega [Ignavibacteria bacterium]